MPGGRGEHGLTRGAKLWRDWLLRAVPGDVGDIKIMYGLAGERDHRGITRVAISQASVAPNACCSSNHASAASR
ncbi:MAG: hypothetical protein ACJ72M_13070 [Propionibacteriaceae bacterium]